MGRRRQRGEGGVHQRRSDGRWVGTINLGYIDGKRRQRSVYARTQRECVRRLAELRAQLDAHGPDALTAAPLTVETWLRYWLDDIAARRVRPTTLNGYRSKIEHYLVPGIGRHRLDKLTPAHVRALDTALAARGLSGATRRQTHAILMRALTVAQREGHVTRNAAHLTDRPTTDREATKPLTPDETAAILRAAHGSPLESRWLAALLLGLRQGEALGLRWEDVDLDADVLHVRQTLTRLPGRGLVFTDPKSKTSRRTLPLPALLRDSLAAAPRRGVLVWCRDDGAPIDPRADWQAWSELLAAAGVRHVRLHDARHAAASLLAALGVHPAVARDLLGHSTTALTMGVYTHTDLTALRAAMQQVDAAHRLPPAG